jgi:signal transduction histidine kinase
MDSSDTATSTISPAEKPVNSQLRELEILNSIFQIMSSASSLAETLEKALDFVLTTIDSAVGWVCLHDQDESCFSFVGYKGLCFSNTSGASPCLVSCVCDRVRKTKEVVIINKLTKGCPLLLIKNENESEELIVGHVSVPLVANSRLVGQLNIAFNDPQHILQGDIDLLKTVAPHLAVLVENARLWEELQNKEIRLKKLLNSVVNAQEEERQRISRELHDEMGQNLTSLLIGLRILENSENCAEKENIIGGLSRTVTEMITSIHDLALELRPTSLDDLGLIPALTQFFSECPDRIGIDVDYQVVGESARQLSHEAEITVYRIVQESLTNVSRHAKASKANVILNLGGKSFIAIIEDNGIGFDPKSVNRDHTKVKHIGLYGMEERAALVGGTFIVESTVGAGTSIFVEIPWDESKNE